MENSFHFFPLWKRGMKGDLTAFQKAKLLPKNKYPVIPRGKRKASKNFEYAPSPYPLPRGERVNMWK
jgi:hypothetical protein